MDRLDHMLALVRRHVPQLRIVPKGGNRWMRLAGHLLRPVVPDFETRFTTVVGSTVYLPREVDEFPRDALAVTLAHELVHQLDQRRFGLGFYFSYAALLPMGRTFRAFWERRAYAVDLMLAFERGGEEEVERTLGFLVELFAGRSYAWMWAGRESARAFLWPMAQAVIEGKLQERDPYREILRAWRGAEEGAS